MKIKFLSTMAFAALAMVSCNNDDEGLNPGGQGELTGEATYALFNIKIADSNQTRTETGAAGSEGAVEKENEIDNAGIYVFQYVTEETGTSEVIQYAESIKGTGVEQVLPTQPVMLTSGKKHLIVVANMTTAVKDLLDKAFGDVKKADGYKEFRAVIAKMADNTIDPTTNLVSNGVFTMSGETDPTLLAGVTETEAKDPTNANHVKIFVDRIVAKIDVKLGALATPNGTELPVMVNGETDPAKKVGDVAHFTYDVRNMNTETYITKRMKGTDFVVSPFSHLIDAAQWPALNSDHRFPALTPGTILPFENTLLSATANYKGDVAFITETTNEFARTANSAYVGLQGFYNPIPAKYVSGYTVAAGKVTLTPTTEAFGGNSWFNFEYDLAFKNEAVNTLNHGYIKTLAGYHTSIIEPSLADIAQSKIKIISAGAITTGDVTIPGFVADSAITHVRNVKAITDYMNGLVDGAAEKTPTLFVFVTDTKNTVTGADLQRQYVSAIYMWNPGDGKTFVHNDGVNFGKLSCAMYNTVPSQGLQCFYRVNIFDEVVGITHQMRYSVVRNHSYHMGISKISKIGFPTDGDLGVDPEQPLNNNTFVQATVTINQWTGKKMDDVELGQ